MSEMKVTDVYGEKEDISIESIDHMIISEELKGVLGLSTEIDDETVAPDLNEMSVVVETDEISNALVYGDLISLSSGEYLTLRFNAKSNCGDMLQVLKTSTSGSVKRVSIDVTGDYCLHTTSKNIEVWEMKILEDRTALLTLTMGTNDVIFR